MSLYPSETNERALGEQSVKVSAVMLTYNHERFIGEAIESFLMQKTNFPCELIITEDCSTDGTRDVIRKYWEEHPDRIRVFLNRKNIGGRRSALRGFRASRGQYVTYCDGDDYWTSPHKLQRQVDFMDSHPDHALCFHSVNMVWEDGSREAELFRQPEARETYTLYDLLDHNFIAACSPMYRGAIFADFPPWYFVMPVGDWAWHVLHALHGPIGYIDEPMGIYRQHGAGIYSANGMVYRLGIAIEMLRRFRCALDKRYRRVISNSLRLHYQRLTLAYLDAGDMAGAKAAAAACLRESGRARKIPSRMSLKLAAKTHIPGPYEKLKDLFHKKHS